MAPVKKRIAKRKTTKEEEQQQQPKRRTKRIKTDSEEEPAAEAPEPAVASPVKVDDDAAEPEAVEQEAAEPEPVEQEAGEPQAAEPQTAEPETAAGPSNQDEAKEDEVEKDEVEVAEAAKEDEAKEGDEEAKEGDDDSPKKKQKKNKAVAKGSARAPKLSWHQRLEQLKEYKERTGNTLVPTRYKENKQLGKWVHNQREQYKMYKKLLDEPGTKKKCSMTAFRVKELEDIGFVWSTERAKRQEEDWQGRLEQLKEYKAKHGDCMVPHGFSEDPSLYEWVHRQRVQHAGILKSGKEPDGKFKDRMAQLEAIGFSFKKQDDVWKKRYEELKAYKDEHGNCEVPTHYSPNPVLGRWVVSQRYEARKRSKGKKGIISQERVDLLDALGFNWAVGKERDRVTWKSRFDELVAFKAATGHFDVSADDNPALHRWCREQKQRLRLVQKNGEDKSKRMGNDRIQAFVSIGFIDPIPIPAATTVAAAEEDTTAAEDAPAEADTITADVEVTV